MKKRITFEEIKEIRKKLGLTQEEFGRLLGVGFVTVNRWENGKAEPKGTLEEVLFKLKILLDEAEKGEEFTINDVKKAIQDLSSGNIIALFSEFLPLRVARLFSPGGVFSLITGLTGALFLKNIIKKEIEDKNDEDKK